MLNDKLLLQRRVYVSEWKVPVHLGGPRQRATRHVCVRACARMCVCVCVCVCVTETSLRERMEGCLHMPPTYDTVVCRAQLALVSLPTVAVVT